MLALAVAVLAVAQQTPPAENEVSARVLADVRGLRQQVAALELQLRTTAERLDQLRDSTAEVQTGLGEVKAKIQDPAAIPFMSAPPESSATVGVAKTVVFSPRVEADPVRRRDTVTLSVKRVETGGSRPLGETMLSGESSVALPLDRAGALYVVEWSTADGQTFDLLLRDGVTGQVAATVQVRPLQSQGRFLFVGY